MLIIPSSSWCVKEFLNFACVVFLVQGRGATLFEFLDCLTLLCAESQDANGIASLQLRLNSAIAVMERDFPMTLQVIF